MAHNNYFQFKQFTIIHEKSAMKVGTDSVLLGAWANPGNANTILDIGSGTGILSLMMAQRTDAAITAIEIDKDAIKEAEYNSRQSKWAGRIKLVHLPFQEFAESCPDKFDFIISNPPFFANGINNGNFERAAARHQNVLSFEDIVSHSKKLLNQKGRIALILPVNEGNQFNIIAQDNGLFLSRITKVKPNCIKPARRYLIEFSKQNLLLVETELTIEYEKHHDYTLEFRELTKDYYLKF